MSKVTLGLAFAAILPFSAASSAASAGTLDITAVGVYDQSTTLDVNGSNTIASAIRLTVQGDSQPLWVWCVDLNHTIGIGSYNPPLVYQTSPVTTDSTGAQSGTGNMLVSPQSQEIETLADIGSALATHSGESLDLTGIQGAIWQIEYPSDTVVGTATQNSDILKWLTYAQAHPATGNDPGIYPVGPNGQGFGVSQGFGLGVPEPAAWAMLILGFAHLGVSLRCRAAALRLSRKRI